MKYDNLRLCNDYIADMERLLDEIATALGVASARPEALVAKVRANAEYAEELERFALATLRGAVLPLAWICEQEPESRAFRAAYEQTSKAIETIKENMAKHGRSEPPTRNELSTDQGEPK